MKVWQQEIAEDKRKEEQAMRQKRIEEYAKLENVDMKKVITEFSKPKNNK